MVSLPNEEEDHYRYGYRVGMACAGDSRKQIKDMGSEKELAQLVGNKLNGLRIGAAPNNISHQEKWGLGFFDGFFDRAREFRV